jgi:hypothetical protein
MEKIVIVIEIGAKACLKKISKHLNDSLPVELLAMNDEYKLCMYRVNGSKSLKNSIASRFYVKLSSNVIVKNCSIIGDIIIYDSERNLNHEDFKKILYKVNSKSEKNIVHQKEWIESI